VLSDPAVRLLDDPTTSPARWINTGMGVKHPSKRVKARWINKKVFMGNPEHSKPITPVYTGKDVCLECGKHFTRLKPNQRFCAGGKCRSVYHNREKGKGLMLTPAIRAELRDLAAAHDVSENEMACRMYQQWTNPQKEPIKYEEIYGHGNQEPR